MKKKANTFPKTFTMTIDRGDFWGFLNDVKARRRKTGKPSFAR